MEKIELGTPDGAVENIEKIAKLFPQVVTEVENTDGELARAVDFDALRDLLGDVAEGQRERYQFTWPGKREAKAEARRPIYKTMIPEPGKSKDWDTTENLYIEGDNLDALKILKETYAGKVKLIYIDPPYNSGDDYLYDDDFTISQDNYDAISGDFDSDNRQLTTNTSSYGRFHSRWCSNFYERALLSRDFLTKDGVLLVSIGDAELCNAQKILDEGFGTSGRLCIFVWKSRAKPTNAGNARFRPQKVAEYVLAYMKGAPDQAIFNVIPAKERTYPHHDEGGDYRTTTILTSNRGTFRRETMRFESNGYKPTDDYRWKAGKETIDKLFASNHMIFNDDGVPMEKKYKDEEKDPLYPIYCYMDSDLTGTAESGKAELTSLVGNKHGFDTVKPVQLMKYFIQTFMNKNDIVLDFYSGSGTTGQALLEQNAEDEGTRKAILVQYPQAIAEQSEAWGAGFHTICDIALSRLRAVSKRINEEHIGEAFCDTGFRVLRIDSSNFKDSYLTPGEISQESLFDFADNVKEGRSDLDLLFEVLPKLGIPYSAKIEERVLAGKKVFFVDGDKLAACFDANVGSDTIEEMAKAKPWYAVIRDSSMADDATHANYEELFRTYSPDTVPQVI